MGNSDLAIIINGECFTIKGQSYTTKAEAFQHIYQNYVAKIKREFQEGMRIDPDNIDRFSDYWDTDLREVKVYEISASYPQAPTESPEQNN